MDDAVRMARDEKAQQVVQDLMQRYGRDNHLVWSAEKPVVLRRGGEEGMALDVGDGVAWLERAEEAVVLGHVQAMEVRGVRLPDKLVRGFRAMLVVLRHHPPSVQTTLYYLRAVLNAAAGYQGMHLPYWREQLEEVEGEVRRLIRGYQGIPTEVPWCVLRSQGTHGEDAEQDVPQSGRGGETGVLSRARRGSEGGGHVPALCVAGRRRLAAGKKECMWRALQAVLPGEEHMLATNRTCDRRGPILVLDTDFGGAAHGMVR